MNATINVKQFHELLPESMEKVRCGARFTVLCRSCPALQILPIESGLNQLTASKAICFTMLDRLGVLD